MPLIYVYGSLLYVRGDNREGQLEKKELLPRSKQDSKSQTDSADQDRNRDNRLRIGSRRIPERDPKVIGKGCG